jgi:uncharacterized damage-inducible protein DinB
MIRELYDYNYWANRRILDKAALVSEEQLKGPTGFSFDSLHGTLVHTMSAEWLWRNRMQESVSPPKMHDPADLPTLAALEAAWAKEEALMRSFLAELRDEGLRRPFSYRNTEGKPCSNPLWESLVHVVLHGMQHRSECAAMLTSFGHSPGWIDFIFFVRERGR